MALNRRSDDTKHRNIACTSIGKCDSRFAVNLGPRISRKGKRRQIAAWGVTALPWELWQARLSRDQETIVRMFGYGDGKLVRPGPILPADW